VCFSKKTVAKYLISVGADVTVIAKTGCTAFDMATLIGKVHSTSYSFDLIWLL